MRTRSISLILALVFSVALSATQAASFNYHGSLQDGGKAAEGNYDLELTLYSAAQGGKVLAGPLIEYKVPVRNGSFSTQVDFGAVQNPAGGAWLGVKIRKADGGDFAALQARAPVDMAATVATGSVCPGAWTIAGNAGNPAGSYLGTADNNPLVFEVNGLQAGTLIPTANATFPNAPNVVFGSSGNSVGTAVGATIGGGGTSESNCGSAGSAPCINAATGFFSTVVGGVDNTASGAVSTVGGGQINTASGNYSVVSGYQNTASGSSATISGGFNNTASAANSSVVGGTGNTASGGYSTVAGGIGNTAAGPNSFAAGTYANVPSGDTGSFVWSDATGNSMAPFSATAANQFLINATGGVGIGTNNPNGNQLRVVGANSVGVWAETDSSNVNTTALHAYNASGYGIVGEGGNVAIYSHHAGSPGNDVYLSTSAVAGDFYGNVNVHGNLTVTGSVSKGGGSFKIDHPLDPANRFLSHSFVESPDMKNIYDGVATLDANGAAWVQLPDYFEALNQDFRYQLTALDAPAPSLYVAQRISGNRFRIAGGAPNQQVSWQVTGTRHDAWANAHRIVVEQNKPAEDRGRYLAPEAFGQPADLAIGRPAGEQP